jgi:tRNA 5-methylaminomethyl-2-thiouridine biosynthesis bifunctional protein
VKNFDCVIIGGGLAGSFCAYFLAKSGLSSLLIEANQIASGASGNDLGGLMPYVTHPSFVAHDLYNLGFDLTSSIVEHYSSELTSAYFRQAAQFPSNERPKKLFIDDKSGNKNGFVISPEEAESLIGLKPASPVFIYNKTLVISPPELCKLLIAKSSCKVIEKSNVIEFKRINSGLVVITNDNSYSSTNVIICNAFDCVTFPECAFFPIKKVRGQVVSFSPSGELKKIKIPLGYNGYYLPSSIPNKAILGTTYDYSFLSPQPCADRNQKMIDTLKYWIPDCGNQQLNIQDTRVSFRTVSKDRLPIAGKISDGVYLSTAHGSRGLHSAGICAQYVTSLILKQTFKQTVADAVDPMRKTLNS